MLLLLTGCLLNVGLYNERRAELCEGCDLIDAWPDCDGDGFGDDVEPTRIASTVRFIQGCPAVSNRIDCDDASTASGARWAVACPGDFSSDHDVSRFASSDYLIVHDAVADPSRAVMLCSAWGGPTGHLLTLDDSPVLAQLDALISRGPYRGWTGHRWIEDSWTPEPLVPACDEEPKPTSLFPDLTPDEVAALTPLLRLQFVLSDGATCFGLWEPLAPAGFVCEREAIPAED